MIILRSPKGWTGPKEVDGKKTEGSWRSHQVPLADMETRPEHVRQLERWMKSYRAEELFDDAGTHHSRAGSDLPPRVTGGWGPIPMPMAASCFRISRCRTFRTTPWTSRDPGP